MKSASRSSPGTQPEQWGDVLPDEVVEGPQLLLDVGCLTSRARTLEQAIDEQGQEVRGVAREERIRGRGKLRWQAAEGLEPRPASQPHLGKPRGRLHVSKPANSATSASKAARARTRERKQPCQRTSRQPHFSGVDVNASSTRPSLLPTPKAG